MPGSMGRIGERARGVSMMAAKAITSEQAIMFHQSQIGHPDCFDGCCLHAAITRAEQAERILEAVIVYTGEVLRSTHGSDVLAFVHGMENDYSKANRLYGELPLEIRERLAAVQLADEKEAELNQLIDEVGETGGI